MSSLTLLLLQLGFLLLLWVFVFGIVYSLRSDLFGVKVRSVAPTVAPTPSVTKPAAATSAPDALTTPVAPVSVAPTSGPEQATTENARRIVITSGPKAGLELPLGDDALTIGRSSESGLVIRDDYTSSHHARLLVWGTQWMVQDLDSTNGTFLSGKRVTTPAEITIGAPIKVGATTFELRK